MDGGQSRGGMTGGKMPNPDELQPSNPAPGGPSPYVGGTAGPGYPGNGMGGGMGGPLGNVGSQYPNQMFQRNLLSQLGFGGGPGGGK